MSQTEQGLYYSGNENSFKAVRNEQPSPVITFDKPQGRDASDWFEDAKARQKVRAEAEEMYDYAKIEIESDQPFFVGVSGDWHLASQIDLEMLKRDVQIMAEHPLVKGNFLMGDLTDSANFNPAQDEDYLSYEEQSQWMKSMLDYIGSERILAMWRGNHDYKWEKKNGVSKYAGLSGRYDAPVFYGNAYIDLVVNGNYDYRLMGSHRLRGNSIYSNPHPSVRGHRETQNCDLVFCGHVHKKGFTQQPVKEFRGSRMTYSVVSGTYQIGTGYTKDSGFGTQDGAELGMYWVLFGHDKKIMTVMDTEQMLSYSKSRI